MIKENTQKQSITTNISIGKDNSNNTPTNKNNETKANINSNTNLADKNTLESTAKLHNTHNENSLDDSIIEKNYSTKSSTISSVEKTENARVEKNKLEEEKEIRGTVIEDIETNKPGTGLNKTEVSSFTPEITSNKPEIDSNRTETNSIDFKVVDTEFSFQVSFYKSLFVLEIFQHFPVAKHIHLLLSS